MEDDNSIRYTQIHVFCYYKDDGSDELLQMASKRNLIFSKHFRCLQFFVYATLQKWLKAIWLYIFWNI